MKTYISNKTRIREKALFVASLFLFIAIITMAGCDLIDPTEVKNPQITEESIVGQPGSMRAALQGIRTTFTDVIDNAAYFTDCVSDNYDNWQTFISPLADFPRGMRSDDLTLNGVGSLYSLAQRVRALVDFAITQVAPKDPTPTGIPDLVAEAILYRGLATLVLAENFSYVPIAVSGPAVPASQLLNAAVADFNTALSTGPAAVKTAAQFALARAYRVQGKKTEAVSAANAALALNATYVFTASFDATTNTNAAWTFAVSRALNDIQPLPRLDFLDPKYTDATGISPIAVLKAEEMHLILAEAAISNNDLATAKARMKDAVNLALGTAGGRTTVQFLDRDPRTNRPNADNITVKADANAPARAGLVKRRSSTTVTIKQISNTSVTTADIDALTAAADHLWMLYLLRQEIFFLEGRRMSDLGIRLPMMKREEETNPTINAGDAGTLVVVPNYVPADDIMDRFTTSGTVVTCTVDMNRVLATNKVSPFTMPF